MTERKEGAMKKWRVFRNYYGWWASSHYLHCESFDDGCEFFDTHAEAFTYALTQARKEG